jgi:hypothetical protein
LDSINLISNAPVESFKRRPKAQPTASNANNGRTISRSGYQGYRQSTEGEIDGI